MVTAKVIPNSWLPKGDVLVEAQYPLVVIGGIPNEKAVVEIRSESPKGAVGQFLESPAPDPRRVTPPCDRLAYCGQCALMHVAPEHQGAIRTLLARDAFAKEGLKAVKIEEEAEIVLGDLENRYVTRLGFDLSDRGRTRVGVWSRHSSQVVAVPKCPVVTPTIRKLMNSLAHHAIEMEMSTFDPVSGHGLLRRALVRESRETGEVLLTLVVSKRNRAVLEYAETIATSVSEITAVWVHVNEGPAQEIFLNGDEGLPEVDRLLGKEAITERYGDLLFEIGAEDTTGANPVVTTAIYQRVLERLATGPHDALVHLLSGPGTLVVMAAKTAGLALGIEPSERAVLRANRAARRAGVSAGFIHGEIDESLDEVKRRLGTVHPTLVMEIFGREPSEQMEEAVVELAPRQIALIAHNPRSLAAAVKRWMERYTLLGAVEVFGTGSHTTQTVTLAVLADTSIPAGELRATRRKVVGRRR